MSGYEREIVFSPSDDHMARKLFPYACDHRCDEFFRWDLPPQEPPYGCPNLPAWV